MKVSSQKQSDNSKNIRDVADQFSDMNFYDDGNTKSTPLIHEVNDIGRKWALERNSKNLDNNNTSGNNYPYEDRRMDDEEEQSYGGIDSIYFREGQVPEFEPPQPMPAIHHNTSLQKHAKNQNYNNSNPSNFNSHANIYNNVVDPFSPSYNPTATNTIPVDELLRRYVIYLLFN